MSVPISGQNLVRATSAAMGPGDGTQGIINGLRDRSVYNLPLDRRRRKDMIKESRSSVKHIRSTLLGRSLALGVTEQAIEELDSHVLNPDDLLIQATPSPTASSILGPASSETWSPSNEAESYDLPTTLSTEPGEPRAEHETHGKESPENESCAHQTIQSTMVLQDVPESHGQSESRSFPNSDQLFNALQADIIVDMLSPIDSDNQRRIARDWLNYVASIS